MCVGVCMCVCVGTSVRTGKTMYLPHILVRQHRCPPLPIALALTPDLTLALAAAAESVSFFHHPTAKTQAVTFRAKPAANSQPGKQPTRLAVNRPTSLAAWQSGRPSTSSICRTYVGYNFILLYFQRRCLLGYFIQIRHV